MNTVQAVASVVLASGESKKSGPLGLAVILVLCVLCYFLFKSMSKHMRKVREEFPSEPVERTGRRDGDAEADAAEPLTKRSVDVPGPAEDQRGDAPPAAPERRDAPDVPDA